MSETKSKSMREISGDCKGSPEFLKCSASAAALSDGKYDLKALLAQVSSVAYLGDFCLRNCEFVRNENLAKNKQCCTGKNEGFDGDLSLLITGPDTSCFKQILSLQRQHYVYHLSDLDYTSLDTKASLAFLSKDSLASLLGLSELVISLFDELASVSCPGCAKLLEPKRSRVSLKEHSKSFSKGTLVLALSLTDPFFENIKIPLSEILDYLKVERLIENNKLISLSSFAEHHDFLLALDSSELCKQDSGLLLVLDSLSYDGKEELDEKINTLCSAFLQQGMQCIHLKGFSSAKHPCVSLGVSTKTFYCKDCDRIFNLNLEDSTANELSAFIGEYQVQDFASLTLSQFDSLLAQCINNSSASLALLIERARGVLVSLVSFGFSDYKLGHSVSFMSHGERLRLKLASLVNSGLGDSIILIDNAFASFLAKESKELLAKLLSWKETANRYVLITASKELAVCCEHVLCFKEDREYSKQARKAEVDHMEIELLKHSHFPTQTICLGLNALNCFYGVSGSGKSRFLKEIIKPLFSRAGDRILSAKLKNEDSIKFAFVEYTNFEPQQYKVNKHLVLYGGLYDDILRFLAQIGKARLLGLNEKSFSLSTSPFLCSACKGSGEEPDAIGVECQKCHGTLFEQKMLDFYYNRKNIAEILSLTVTRAKAFFQELPLVLEKLSLLEQLGFSDVPLGISKNKLSCSQLHRLSFFSALTRKFKLDKRKDRLGARESQGLFILDNPLLSLNSQEAYLICQLLRDLVQEGHTIIYAENRQELRNIADCLYQIDTEGLFSVG